MRHQGRITTWKDDQGFGFITPLEAGKQVFVHITSFSSRARRPELDALVTYELGMDDNGRPQAKSVGFAGERIKAPRRRRRSNVPVLFAVCFLLVMAGAYSDGRIPRPVPVLYGILGVVTFLAYGFDKSAALSHSWRTRESTLHFMALLGGWPGAIFAQRVFRHKSSKPSFQSVFWITVVLNCVALGALLSPWGVEIVNPLLEDLLRGGERWATLLKI